ncbi:hypothetical protein ACFL6I_22525 [candidate division KSB1 bacterium]
MVESADEMKKRLEEITTTLKKNVASKTYSDRIINDFFANLERVLEIISNDEAKKIIGIQTIIKDYTENARDFTVILDDLANEETGRGNEKFLSLLSHSLTESFNNSHNLLTRLRDLSKGDPGYNDAFANANELDTNMRSLAARIVNFIMALHKEVSKTEEARRRREDEDKAELIYEFEWFIFYDKKVRRRCEDKMVLPDEIEEYKVGGWKKIGRRTKAERRIALRIVGGKARKGEKFMRPVGDVNGIPYPAFSGAESIGLAVKLLPSTGAEATGNWITKTKRRKWRWEFWDKDRFPKELKEMIEAKRTISGRVVSKLMIERMALDVNNITGSQINDMMRGHFSIGIKEAPVFLTYLSPEGVQLLDGMIYKTDEKGFFKMETQGAVPIIVNSKHEGQQAKHIDTPLGRGGNGDPDNPPPSAPIKTASENNVVVALELDPDFSKELMDAIKELDNNVKEYKEKFTGAETAIEHAKKIENVVNDGKKIIESIQKNLAVLDGMMKEHEIIHKYFVRELANLESTTLKGFGLIAAMNLFLNSDNTKTELRDKLLAATPSLRFTFEEDGDKFKRFNVASPDLPRAINIVAYELKYIDIMGNLYKYLTGYLAIFIRLNPKIATSI